jgi:hypothetical protein
MPEDRRDEDMVLLHSPTEDGAGVRVVRARRGNIELGEVRPLVEGKPVHGDVVSLKPREGEPRICDVHVEYAKSEAKDGPAQVATETYRDNWEATFGSKRTKKAVAPS